MSAGDQENVEQVGELISAGGSESSKSRFFVVGIGASAGGLAAFEQFFSGMPAGVEPGMAFVLVQHLAPDHTSLLAELVRRFTTLTVLQVEDGMPVEPNHVYIIAPNHDMTFLNGKLHLVEPAEPRGHRMPIDYFFRSLAQDQHDRAIGIVLSGTGSDGTQGVRAIKAEAGMVMVQSAESAEFDGMPRSVIETGIADYELAPAAMLPQLIAYASQEFNQRRDLEIRIEPKSEEAMKKIFVLVRSQTGHDFSLYKPSTIYRRIKRRMAVQHIPTVQDYVKYIQESPVEVEALFRDMLIGVTSFFRDPDVFEILEKQIIPQLFKDKSAATDLVRVWISGCSTGEEAYSIAILIREYLESSKSECSVQIYATDIDSRAIATARAGVYSVSIASDVNSERLSRFFSINPGENVYRISKNIREMLVFSEHNVIKDPPFSKIDLISCRNLLIYFGTELQKKLMPLFHFALVPNGVLLLGTSEGIGDYGSLFKVLDRKAKLYQRQGGVLMTQRKPLGLAFPSTALSNDSNIDSSYSKLRISGAKGAQELASKIPLRDILEKSLMNLVAPSAALINAQGDILYLHGRTGMFLELAAGESGINNILRMAREGLQQELAMMLSRVVVSQEPVSANGILVRTNGHYTRVEVSVSPVTAHSASSTTTELNSTSLYLVTIKESTDTEKSTTSLLTTDISPTIANTIDSTLMPSGDPEARISALLEELHARDEYLQSAREELESSNEELKSSNEEMQSINEEMQSTNEELETSKEELQSVNEEFATVNMELQAKVHELSHLNNDMNNLLSGTGIATVFVDHQLRILRFTPAMCAIINLILSDVGRPIAHTVTNLVGYDRLVQDAQEVLDSLVAKVVEVQTKDGKWYTMRMQPYRTIDNVIEGAVINFTEITSLKRIQAELESDKAKLQFKSTLLNAIGEAVIATDLQGEILYWNEAAERTYGWKSSEVIGKNVFDVTSDDDGKIHASEIMEVLKKGHSWSGEFLVRHRDGHRFPVKVTNTSILNDQGNLTGIIGVSSDITLRKNAEDSLRRSNELARLAVVVRDSRDAITVQDLDGRIIAWNPAAVKIFGWTEAEALMMNVRDRIPKSLQKDALVKEYELSQAEILEPYRTQRLTKDGSVLEVWITATALVNEEGHMHAIATTERVGLESENGKVS
ncbi:MAG: chemotaxis protein CheB [Pirellula sp.]|jgi:two-component system CheB/CheR fusion protein